MSAARELLDGLSAIGATIEPAGDRLILRAGTIAIPATLVSRIREAKADLLAAIDAGRTELWGDAEDERAAIAEHDGGAPRAWAEALARLDPAQPPRDLPPKRWVRFLDDCGRFLDGGWAAHATALGWGPLDLFGCNRARPYRMKRKTYSRLLVRIERLERPLVGSRVPRRAPIWIAPLTY